MSYATYTTADFSKDPDFIRWVRTPTDESNQFWWGFMNAYPHKIADIQAAAAFVKSLQFREADLSEVDLARLKQRIMTDVERTERAGASSSPTYSLSSQRTQWYRQPRWAVAAVLVLSMAVGLVRWKINNNPVLTYQTEYGQIQEIQLVDGSVVTLNAHSTFRVADRLEQARVREVWLEGEAYFDIAKRSGTAFIVHTPEASVRVLGTEFNVNSRHKVTQVMLHEGSVQLSTRHRSTLVMQPGDLAIVKTRNQPIELKRVQPKVHDTWKEAYIVLDGKPLPDIIQRLEDTFGVTIQLMDKQLAHKTLTGRLRTEDADDCIENLAIILDVAVRKNGDSYVFE